MQDSFGSAGHCDASNLMQEANICAGELIHAAEDGSELSDELKSAVDETKGLKGKNMKNVERVKKAEAATEAMQVWREQLSKPRSSRRCLMNVHQRDPERIADSATSYVAKLQAQDGGDKWLPEHAGEGCHCCSVRCCSTGNSKRPETSKL